MCLYWQQHPLSCVPGPKSSPLGLFLLFSICFSPRSTAPLPLQVAIAADIAKRQGVSALYRGLSAGLLRQATYTTARLGIYDTIFAAAKKFNDNKVSRTERTTTCTS